MKARLVYTKFWTNPEIENLSPLARYLFLYCLTNPYIGFTGAYKLSDARLAYETGYPIDTLSESFVELEKLGFILKRDGWIIVLNTEKHNNYSGGSKTKVAYEKEVECLPNWIKDTLSIPYTKLVDRVGIPPEIETEIEIEKETEIEIEKEKEIESKTNNTPTSPLETPAFIKAKQTADKFRLRDLA